MDDTGHLYALEILKPHRRTVHAAQHELRQSPFIIRLGTLMLWNIFYKAMQSGFKQPTIRLRLIMEVQQHYLNI